MQRSVGVTLSAVLVFFGCGMFLLFAVLLAFTTQMAPAASALPILRGALIFDILLDLAFVGWGVASGIGLLQLQQWARISMLVFSGIMIFFCLIPMAIFPFIPIPQPAAAPANLMFFIRMFLELFYGLFVALGAFWIYFFNRRNVKEQFKGTQAIQAAIPGAPAMEVEPKKPIPIIVLAVLLLVGGCFLPLMLFLHTPVLFFSYPLQGSAGKITLLLLTAVNIGTGIGLLRLRPWGWALALVLQAFNILNVACFFLVPGAADRLNTAMAQQYAAMGMSNMPPGFSTPLIMSVSFSFGLLMAVAFLWILLAYRKAFQTSPAPAATV
jgi:hypothetical protein